jgi:hypothetical protein
MIGAVLKYSPVLTWIRWFSLSYVIIILVIALALAPLSHFIPTKAQRKAARLREYAATHGLYVEFRDVPHSGALAVAKPMANTIYYGKRVRGRGLEGQIAWLFGAEGWIGLPRREPVPSQLSSLPGGILAASADQDSCGIYWQESGEEAEIDQICTVLEELANTLYQ